MPARRPPAAVSRSADGRAPDLAEPAVAFELVGTFRLGDLATSDSWLSSVKDQNQGTRNDKQPHPAMRLPPTVLFHPDFNRRLRSCTESADPSPQQSFEEGARGLRPYGPYRRWGLSPRPENIGRPEWTA